MHREGRVKTEKRPERHSCKPRTTKGCQDHQRLKKRFFTEPPRRKQPSQHPGVRLRALEPGENRFLLFKPPSLWYFITAASQKTQTIPKGLCGSFRTCPKILDMTANKRWKPFPQTPFSSAQTCDLHLRCQTGWK